MHTLQDKISDFISAFDQADYKGYSVYDAFNSPITKPLLKLNSKFINVCVTQLFKRFPRNIRRFALVEKSINPKSLGLVLKAKLMMVTSKDEVQDLLDLILQTKNTDFENSCWGYNWDYFTLRGGTFPKHYPNAIVTYFIGDALLDYYLKFPDDAIKTELLSIKAFFEQDINKTDRDGGICYSYSPIDHKEIYNASALISRFLYRSEKILKLKFSDLEKSIKYLVDNQNSDGSWYYGYNKNQKWIDSFHTEYMLEFFNEIDEKLLKDLMIHDKIQEANKFYLKEFYHGFVCNYFPNKVYPINIHSIASRVIYLSNQNFLKEAEEIIVWTFKHLYNHKKKAFFFEKQKFYTNKNVYHRWNESWMYLALATFLDKKHEDR